MASTSPEVARRVARRVVDRHQARIFKDRQDRGREKLEFEVDQFGEWFTAACLLPCLLLDFSAAAGRIRALRRVAYRGMRR